MCAHLLLQILSPGPPMALSPPQIPADAAAPSLQGLVPRKAQHREVKMSHYRGKDMVLL